jgi:hypothetical protein
MAGIWEVQIKSTHFGSDGTKTSGTLTALLEIEPRVAAEGGNLQVRSFSAAIDTVLFPETFGSVFADYFIASGPDATLAGTLKVDASTGEATSFRGTATLNLLPEGEGVVVAALTGKRLDPSTPTSSIFVADFESGLFPYTETDPEGSPTATLWHAEGSCAAGTAIPASMGAGAAAYNRGDEGPPVYNFDNGSTNAGAIQGPAIAVPPGTRGLQIVFETIRQTEGGVLFDQSFVEARTVGAESWTTLTEIIPQVPCGSSPETVTLGFGKKSIKPIFGASFQHRFRFDTVDAGVNGTIGWYVDNVQVRTID